MEEGRKRKEEVWRKEGKGVVNLSATNRRFVADKHGFVGDEHYTRM